MRPYLTNRYLGTLLMTLSRHPRETHRKWFRSKDPGDHTFRQTPSIANNTLDALQILPVLPDLLIRSSPLLSFFFPLPLLHFPLTRVRLRARRTLISSLVPVYASCSGRGAGPGRTNKHKVSHTEWKVPLPPLPPLPRGTYIGAPLCSPYQSP